MHYREGNLLRIIKMTKKVPKKIFPTLPSKELYSTLSQ